MKQKSRTQTKKRAKPSPPNRGSKRVTEQAASAPRVPVQDEELQRSSDGREEQNYRDEVMQTRVRR